MAVDGKEYNGKPVMLYFMIGGLTLLEIAALRFLSKDPTFPYSIVIATTKVVSGADLIQSLHYDISSLSVPLD